MAFDPDAYLAKTKSKFDPDEYLKPKSKPDVEPVFSPEEQSISAPVEGIASIKPQRANAMTADEYRAQVAAREAQGYDRTFGGTAIDVGVTLLKSAIGLPEAFVGLADIPTLGYAGKILEDAGYKPKEAKAILDTYLSEAQQAANRKVRETKGFLPTIGAALQNPSVIATTVGESLAPMIGGAGIAQGVLKAAPALAPYLAGAIGEGVIGAGSSAEQIRQEAKDKLLTGKQALAAVGSGVGTAAFGVAGGKLAAKLGLDDIDTLLVTGSTQGGGSKSVKDFAKRSTASGISEGVFEEMPQSAQETMWMNYAQDKPLLEGVPEAAGMGLVTGAAMGVGATAARGRRREEPQVPPEAGIAGLKQPSERIEPTFEVEPLPPQPPAPEAGITDLIPKVPAAPAAPAAAAPAAPVAEEDQPAQDLEAMLKEALAATGTDINNVNVPKVKEPVVEAPKTPTNRTEYIAEVRRQAGDLQPGDVLENDLGDKWTVDVVMRNKDGEITGFLPREGNPETGERETLTLDDMGSILLPSLITYQDGTRGVSKPGKVERAKPAAEQPPSTKLIEEVLPETKPAPTDFDSALDNEHDNGVSTGNAAIVRTKQDLESDYGPLTNDQVAQLNAAYQDGVKVSDEIEGKTPTARTKEQVEAELKELMLESIRDKTPNPERDAQIEKLTAERKALEPAAPAKPAAKVSKAKVSEEEKIVDAIKDSAYMPNTWQTTRTTVDEFIAKHGKKTFERAVEMGLLDNKIGDGRLFPSNKYAYETSLNYYDAQGNKLKQPTVAEAKPAEPTKVEAEEPKADFGNFTVADYANDLQLLKTDTSVRPNYVVLTIGLDKQNESKPESIAYVRRQMEPIVEANRAQFSEDLAKQGAGVIKDAMDNLLKYGRNPIWAEKILMKLRSVGGSQARLANAMLAGARDMWEKGDFHDAAVRMEYFAKSDDNRSRAFRPNYGIDDKTAINEFRGRGGPQEDKFSAGPERAKLIMEELKRQDKGEETAPTKKAVAKRVKKEVKPSGPVPEAAEMDKLKQEMQDALGDLSMVLTKGTRLNIVPEDEQKLLPILSRVMDIAFKMGYIKFKEAAKYVLDMIRAKMGDDQADQISLDHLQGAYISMAGKYQDEGASTKKEVMLLSL